MATSAGTFVAVEPNRAAKRVDRVEAARARLQRGNGRSELKRLGRGQMVIEVPNNIRDRSSSCGSCGLLAKVISGLNPVPRTITLASRPGPAPGRECPARIGRTFAIEADDPAVELEVAPGEIKVAAHEIGSAVKRGASALPPICKLVLTAGDPRPVTRRSRRQA